MSKYAMKNSNIIRQKTSIQRKKNTDSNKRVMRCFEDKYTLALLATSFKYFESSHLETIYEISGIKIAPI